MSTRGVLTGAVIVGVVVLPLLGFAQVESGVGLGREGGPGRGSIMQMGGMMGQMVEMMKGGQTSPEQQKRMSELMEQMNGMMGSMHEMIGGMSAGARGSERMVRMSQMTPHMAGM